MKHWTIGKRITLGFTAILAILVAMAVASFLLLKQIKAHQEGILSDALPGVATAGQIKYLACDAELNLLRVIRAKSVEERKTFAENLKADEDQNTEHLDDYERDACPRRRSGTIQSGGGGA